MTQTEIPTCPSCKAKMVFALPPGGSGPRRFQCLNCDVPDPLKSGTAGRWLEGLRPPE